MSSISEKKFYILQSCNLKKGPKNCRNKYYHNLLEVDYSDVEEDLVSVSICHYTCKTCFTDRVIYII